MDLLKRFDILFALAIDIHSYTITEDSKKSLVEALFQATKEEQSAKPSPHITTEDMDIARATVYFFVDEVLMDEDVFMLAENTNNSTQISLAWYNHSLQNHYFNTEKGGELFFLYLEELLNRILLDPQNLTEAQIYQLSLNEKFTRTLQIIAGLEKEQQSIEAQSSFALLKVFAKCLLFGFRGRYYEAQHDPLLKELRQNAFTYLNAEKEDSSLLSMPTLQNYSQQSEEQKSSMQKQKRSKLGYFFYLTCPFLVSIIWYLYCAQTVSQIPFK